MDNTPKEWIYLATLLHGVGIFRKVVDIRDSSAEKRGSDSYAVDFVNEHCQLLSCLDGGQLLVEPIVGWLSDTSCPENSVGGIIKEAECLSGGFDKDGHGKICQGLLRPIQGSVARGSSFVYTYCLSPVQYVIGKDSFPHKNNFPAGELQSMYKKLWDDFYSDFCKVRPCSCHAFAETLLGLLFKYTSNVPAANGTLQDVSLYDYIKSSAALAVCLHDASSCGSSPDEPFLLVGADFSGIQPYIYNIVSKYAGKNLKGRSFYIRLLSDAIVRYILHSLDLPKANVIYNSGGCFYLIAPNTDLVKQRLNEATDIIMHKLFEAHGTSLFVAIDSVPLSKDVLSSVSSRKLGDVWHDLFVKRDKAKQAKFHDIVEKNYDVFFSPSEHAAVACDSVTGEEINGKDDKRSFPDGGNVRTLTSEQIKLGAKLRDFSYVFISSEDIKCWDSIMHIDPISLGIKYYFMNETEWKKQSAIFEKLSGKVVAVKYNDDGAEDRFTNQFSSFGNIIEWDFYGGNEVAGGKRCPTFEQICSRHDDDAEGSGDAFERLGVLRMDVDNLGSIFQKGISPDRASLSRFSALSRSLDFFFSGYLNTLWKETDPEHSLIIYSGGDDLFIVGSWDVTLMLAERIRKDFRAYTCNNSAFSISGGIALIPSKFPIIKGASLSDTEESRAKAHCCGGKQKNSISFLGMALNWDEEYPIVKEAKDVIVKASNVDGKQNSKALPRSFVSKVLTHWSNANIKDHCITIPKTFWMMTYDLSRMKERVGNEAKNIIDLCKDDVCSNRPGRFFGKTICTEYNPLELWAFACRWAELEMRSKTIKTKNYEL